MTAGALDVLTAVVAILDRLDIPYVVGGSVASSLVGESRATLDVDIAVSLEISDVAGLVGALSRDHYVSEEAAADAVRRRGSFNAIHLATMQKIDLFVLGDGPLDRGQMTRRQLLEPAPATEVAWDRRRSHTALIPERYRWRMAFTVRTDDQLEQALDALTRAEGLSRQEIIRRAVIERYERAEHSQQVHDSADRMLQRWGDVLDRLGRA